MVRHTEQASRITAAAACRIAPGAAGGSVRTAAEATDGAVVAVTTATATRAHGTPIIRRYTDHRRWAVRRVFPFHSNVLLLLDCDHWSSLPKHVLLMVLLLLGV